LIKVTTDTKTWKTNKKSEQQEEFKNNIYSRTN
jgi:hypothetical protein